MNSLHRIVLTTLTILATSTFLYLLWKSFSLIGHPLGRCLTNLIRYLSDDSNNNNDSTNNNNGENTTETRRTEQQKIQQILDRTSSILGAMLGFFLFITLFPLALESSDEIPSQWLVEEGGGESERLVSAGLWVGWMAVRCWGETAVVLAVLAGVVKGLGLDVATTAAAGVVGSEEKDSKRSL
jgi:hypothetical protein